MVTKKSHQQTEKGKTQTKARIIYEGKQRKTGWIIPVASIILLIIVAGVLFKLGAFAFDGKKVQTEQNVLVMVNGEPIYLSELDAQWDILPPETKLSYTRDMLLEELIQEKLLLQEAEKLDLMASDEEVDAFINSQLTQVGMTVEQLEEMFISQGTSLEEMRKLYAKQLSIAKLFDTKVEGTINASEDEIGAYYAANIESFHQGERVTIRHILVEVNDEFNDSQAQERVDMILDKLEASDNADFCILVENYSSDFGSITNCGEYTFARGVMMPEFENAGFDMAIDEVGVTQTSYGYHIMHKLAELPEGYLALEDTVAEVPGNPTVKSLIEQIIIEEKAKAIFDAYMTELTATANIEYQEEVEETEDVLDEEVAQITEEATEDVLDEEASQIAVNVVVDEDPVDETIVESDVNQTEMAEESLANETNSTEAVIY